MFSFFSKKDKQKIEELNTEIQNLNQMLVSKSNQIEELKSELLKLRTERSEETKNFKIKQKQMEILEKNLRDMRENNNILKEDKKVLKNTTLDAKLPLKKHKYKIPLEKYFTTTKFKEILEKFNQENIVFVDELDIKIINNYSNEKKSSEIEKRYNDFISGDIDLDTKIYALKGERINKLFSKNRKFISFMNENGYEYLDDIIDYDFMKLKENGFKDEQVSEFVEKVQNYYNKFLVKEEK